MWRRYHKSVNAYYEEEILFNGDLRKNLINLNCICIKNLENNKNNLEQDNNNIKLGNKNKNKNIKSSVSNNITNENSNNNNIINQIIIGQTK